MDFLEQLKKDFPEHSFYSMSSVTEHFNLHETLWIDGKDANTSWSRESTTSNQKLGQAVEQELYNVLKETVSKILVERSRMP